MNLTEDDVMQQLGGARQAARDGLLRALRGRHVVGITGESGDGKSALTRQVLGQSNDFLVVWVDLDGVYSANHLKWRWTRALATAVLSPSAWSSLTTGRNSTQAPSARREMARLHDLIGGRWSGLAVQAAPDAGLGDLDDLDDLMDATITADSGDQRAVVLALDHLEAPWLTYRHPLDVAELLWRVRSAAQHAVDLRIMLLCRPPAVELAAGPDAAFFGDGEWLTVAPPRINEFLELGFSIGNLRTALGFTGGHPAATVELTRILERTGISVQEALETIAEGNRDSATRAVRYSSSLHRLGGHLLREVAWGTGPYEGTPDARSKEVGTGMRQLYIAGLVRRVERDAWVLSDPRVAWALAPALSVERFPSLRRLASEQLTEAAAAALAAVTDR